MFQIRYSFVYFKLSDYGLMYLILSILLRIAFDETFTYWIHRIFHTNRILYGLLHKIHHKSVEPSLYYAVDATFFHSQQFKPKYYRFGFL